MAGNLAEVWSRSASERLGESIRASKIDICFAEVMRFITRVLRIGILAYGVWLVITQYLTIGAVIAAAYLGRTAYSLVLGAMQRWEDLVDVGNSFARIRAAMQVEDEVGSSMLRNDVPVSLVFEDVSFRYANQFSSVFRNVDVEVAPGEALYVIGSSAAGKTTFSRVATGLLKPRSGQVRLGDVNVHRLTHSAEACRVGYLPQYIHLFRGTIRENIARMAEGDPALVIEAAKLAGVHDAVLQLPEGYDTMISEDEPLLSTGRRKEIAIARAFYGWPSLVVLDEPESHLDQEGRAALTSAIRTVLAQGAIVIVTTQSKNRARRMANKVILLDDSRVRLLTTPEEITTLGARSVRPRISD
jgi:ATP-binding cassette subfamily C protein